MQNTPRSFRPTACLDRDWPPQANSIPATSMTTDSSWRARRRTECRRYVRANDGAALGVDGVGACSGRTGRGEPHVSRCGLPAAQRVGRLDDDGDVRREPEVERAHVRRVLLVLGVVDLLGRAQRTEVAPERRLVRPLLHVADSGDADGGE